MTLKTASIYVWIWLPQQSKPVLCGRLIQENQYHIFSYEQSYLQNKNAIPIDPIELPLNLGLQRSDANIHRALRDAAPDAWGRRVILYQAGLNFPSNEDELTEIDFLLHSNSNRIGALHFQTSDDEYLPREIPTACLEDLMNAALKLEAGQPLPKELGAALLHGTSIGGARPKAFLNQDQTKQYIAKFSSNTDYFPIVKAEFVAMRLAKDVGINASNTELRRVLGKDILLVERFDRSLSNENLLIRHFMVSALTALQLHEMEARYASYLNLADFIRKYSKNPINEMHELYRRMVFNILIGNTDDHARNHAFFWDGQYFTLTPAYDICPNLRVGHIATQAMQVGKIGAKSTLKNALSACERFELTHIEAENINEEIVTKIKDNWSLTCDLASLKQQDRKNLERATILCEYCFEE